MRTSRTWQLQEARNRFSEVIKQTAFAPQSITLRGESVAMVISMTNYRQLTKPQKSLVDILRSAPHDFSALEFPERKAGELREVTL